MSTTIAHPGAVPSGLSRKTVVGALAALVAMAGIGFGIASNVDSGVTTKTDQSLVAEVASRAALMTVPDQSLVAEVEQRSPLPITPAQSTVEHSGWTASMIDYWASTLAAKEAQRKEGERLFQLNDFAYETSQPEPEGPGPR